MTQTAAAFDSWEERWAKYLVHDSLASPGLPGMTVSAIASTLPARAAYVRLLTADPRAAILYPNAFAAVGGFNATYEPTQAIYQGYAPVGRTRTSTNWNVAASGGGFVISNAGVMAFPTSGGASAGAAAYITHAGLCLRNWQGTSDFLLMVAVLTVPLAITAGGGDTPTFQIDQLTFSLK